MDQIRFSLVWAAIRLVCLLGLLLLGISLLPVSGQIHAVQQGPKVAVKPRAFVFKGTRIYKESDLVAAFQGIIGNYQGHILAGGWDSGQSGTFTGTCKTNVVRQASTDIALVTIKPVVLLNGQTPGSAVVPATMMLAGQLQKNEQGEYHVKFQSNIENYTLTGGVTFKMHPNGMRYYDGLLSFISPTGRIGYFRFGGPKEE